MPLGLYVCDAIQLVLLLVYVADNCFYGYVSGLSKMERRLNLALDFFVIAVVMGITV